MRDYQYPLDLDWSTDEMVIVMNLWDRLEQAYEKGIPAADKFLESLSAVQESCAKYRGRTPLRQRVRRLEWILIVPNTFKPPRRQAAN
jgi:hypothetical protein